MRELEEKIRVSVYVEEGRTSRIIIEAKSCTELDDALIAIEGEILDIYPVDKPANSDASLVGVFEGTIRRAVSSKNKITIPTGTGQCLSPHLHKLANACSEKRQPQK